MIKLSRNCKRIGYVLAIALVSSTASAQLVASKDLTISSQADQIVAAKFASDEVLYVGAADSSQDCFLKHSDGAVFPYVPEKLTLRVISVEPRSVTELGDITVIVRLTNEGTSPIKIPWGETLPAISPELEFREVDAARILISLGTLPDRKFQNTLKGLSILLSDARTDAQSLEIPAMHWIEVKVRAKVACAYQEDVICKVFRSDEKSELVVTWFEGVYGASGKGCQAETSYKAFRDVKSKPVRISFTAIAPN